MTGLSAADPRLGLARLHRRVVASLADGVDGSWRVWVFNGLLAAACAFVWATALGRFGDGAFLGSAPHLAWWELAIAFYLAEVFVVHLHFRKQAHSLSLTEMGLTFGLLVATPGSLLVGQLVGTTVALLVNRRQHQLTKLFFNVAELPLCSGIALLVFRSLAAPGDSRAHVWMLVLFACAVAHVAGVLLVSAVIAIAEERFRAPQLARTLAVSTLGAVTTASFGLAGVELLLARPGAVLLLVVPVVAWLIAFRAYMQQREQREHVEFLYESMRAAQGAPEFGLAVGQLLVAARGLLRAEYAEILLLPPSEDRRPLRSVSSDEGELLMSPQERLSPGDAVAFARVAATGSATLLVRRRSSPHQLDAFLSARRLEDAIVGPLRDESRTFGLLVVGERAGDVSTFGDGDVELFETFAGHASILLENGRLEHSLAEVTQLKEQLRHQAYHDALTGLPNRVYMLEAVEHELAGARAKTAVLYVDLDRFKSVNDTWGHSVGDELLIEFARRLSNAIRSHDTAARIGGDEFAVIVRDADAEAALAAAQRVLDATGGTYALSCGEVACHASVGLALGEPGIGADELVRNADIAMYSVKRSDRPFALYEAELHEELRAQRQLALDLEAALERREIVVHYQPVVRLADGAIEGLEVLARWRHPTRGLLPAADFLPVAEEAGLVVELGRVVLDQALEAARRWPRPLSLWLNLAPAELQNERLVETLAEALERSGIDAGRLVIEVTESSVVQANGGAVETMRRLRDLGAAVTIDDFGTGYSSLSRLAEFPIESLKIPKPFVDKLVGEAADETFVDAILRLAGSLGLATVAEGIEQPAQAARLRELGCTLGQGFLFGRPAPAEEIEPLLRPQDDRSAPPAAAALAQPA